MLFMTSERTDPQEIAIPLFEEQASIAKRRIVTGNVQVSTVTREREQVIEEVLAREHVEIERTPINKPIEAMPAVREQGDIIVIPIVEETLIIQRRLVLKEEVRVRRVRNNENHRERVLLRWQEAVVTRTPVETLTAPIPAGDALPKTENDK
jgi:uncharacterized protein (TIGR02271 family)